MPFGGVTSGDVAPWIEKLARVGFAAKGVLYVTLGVLTTLAALGMGGSSGTDSRGAMRTLLDKPFGRPLLAVIALGLVGYAVWRIIEGIKDPEHRGSNAKGIALRVGFVGRGIIHLGLAYTAASLALWQRDASGGGQGAKHWTAKVLDWPGGQYLLWAVALGLGAYGIYQLYKAAKAKLNKRLQLGRLTEGSRRFVIGVSRFGIAARGVVFGMIGVLLARAASAEDATQAGGVGESLRALGRELGKWPFLAVAVGLIAYGIYEFINAKYRRIEAR